MATPSPISTRSYRNCDCRASRRDLTHWRGSKASLPRSRRGRSAASRRGGARTSNRARHAVGTGVAGPIASLSNQERNKMNTYAVAASRPAGFGLLGFGLVLGASFAVVTLVSGWKFTVDQFSEFWYYILPLGAGFGLQVALYMRLRLLLHQSKDARTLLASSRPT